MGTREYNRIVQRTAKAVRLEYLRRQRVWVMTYLPIMPEDQWKQYTTWVEAFRLGPQDHKTRKAHAAWQQAGRVGRGYVRAYRSAKLKRSTLLWKSSTVPRTE